jgi:hypothetical protein
MLRRSLGRSAALALIGLMAVTGLASADAIITDGDVLEAGPQPNTFLGTYLPGEVFTVPVDFQLRCSTSNHLDPEQVLTLGLFAASPAASVLEVTPGTIGPVPPDWPLDGAACGEPLPTMLSSTPAMVTMRAPTTPNVNYTYTVGFSRSYSPTGNLDGSAVSVTPSVVFRFDVAPNAAPTLVLPPDTTVQGDTTGGALADFTVSATDLHDDPAPTPECDVAQGQLLPVGTTTVTCRVTDRGGLTTSGSFTITVEDTTPPTFVEPADVAVITGDPTGAVVDYTTPMANDIVDAVPTVECQPGPGTHFAVGTTTVACTATDDEGNIATIDFDVVLDYVPSHVASAAWLEPVSGGTLVANRGRNVPVKVVLAVDGVVRTSGDASLVVSPCGGGTGLTLPLTYGGGRWNAGLDTGPLDGWCQTVTATIDGLTAGSFDLDLGGGEATKARTRGQ